MRELRFEGLSEDGSRLILAGKDGQRWALVIDERIEAAVRRDRARLGQVEIEQSGALRPREIQARIRAGATAEDVAAASGLPIDRIRRFEGPVLTERYYMANQAGKVELRREEGDVTVDELVMSRLAAQGVDPLDVTWDSWRREDGSWLVLVAFPIGAANHVASWVYDTANRTVTPADENGAGLLAEDPDPTGLRLVPQPPSHPGLASVASLARGARRDEFSQAGSGDAAVTEIDFNSRRTVLEDGPFADSPGAEPDAASGPASAEEEPEAAEEAALAETPEQDAPGADDEVEQALFESAEPPVITRPVGKPPVPSFDDILFGPGPKR
ncbi:MAG: septation protein SepH [Candidatus Nanopelagicales bacterium]